MVDTPINTASVTMRRRNAVMHALLHSSLAGHISILVQESWMYRIGTARKDTAKDAVGILGVTVSPSQAGSRTTLQSESPKGAEPR